MAILGLLARIAIVVAINFACFLIIPLSKDLLNKVHTQEEKSKAPQRRIIAQVNKPKKKKETKQPTSKTRKVSSGSAKSISNSFKFKLTPDLGLSAGGGGVAIQQEGEEAEVFDGSNVDEEAVPIAQEQPAFPSQARKLAIEGSAEVTFVIGTNGKVEAIENITAPHQSFESSIRKSMGKWKFTPAQKNGVPVKQKASIVIDFSLDN